MLNLTTKHTKDNNSDRQPYREPLSATSQNPPVWFNYLVLFFVNFVLFVVVLLASSNGKKIPREDAVLAGCYEPGSTRWGPC